jgi:hypothetical protein
LAALRLAALLSVAFPSVAVLPSVAVFPSVAVLPSVAFPLVAVFPSVVALPSVAVFPSVVALPSVAFPSVGSFPKRFVTFSISRFLPRVRSTGNFSIILVMTPNDLAKAVKTGSFPVIRRYFFKFR